MKMRTSHWKMRIRPGISEIFFLIARWFSIRQLFFHFFLFLQLFCWKHPQNEKYCGSLRTAQSFSARISLQQGDSEATGAAHLMWSGGRRRSEGGMLGQIFTCCQHVTCSLCHSSNTSWLRALAPPCLTGCRRPPEREVETLPVSIKPPSGVWISDTY